MLYNPGKSAKQDYSVNDLPSTRKEVFKDVLRYNFLTILKIGAVLLLFLLPILVFAVIKDYFLIAFETVSETEDVTSNIRTLYLIYYAAMVVGFMIFSIALSGIGRVLRQLLWEKPLFFSVDFVQGVKENWKQYLASALIFGVFYYAVHILKLIEIDEVIKGAIFGVLYLVIFPVAYLACFKGQVYTDSYSANLKHAGKLYLAHLLVFAGLGILFVLCLFSVYIPFLFIKYVLVVTYIVVCMPIILVIDSLYTFYVFDYHINQYYAHELYDLGVHRKNPRVFTEENNNQE